MKDEKWYMREESVLTRALKVDGRAGKTEASSVGCTPPRPTRLTLALMGSSGTLFVFTLCKQSDASAGFNFSVCACIKAIASID